MAVWDQALARDAPRPFKQLTHFQRSMGGAIEETLSGPCAFCGRCALVESFRLR